MTDAPTDIERYVRLLYHGILRRAPDAGGFRANCAYLENDPSPAGMIDVFEQVLASPESTTVGHRVDRHPLRAVVPDAGPRTIIPLGTNCYPARLLQNLGVKRASYPLDWCFSSPAMIVDVLQDDFDRFLDPQYYEPQRLANGSTPDIGQCQHSYYRDRFGVQFVFNHRDPSTDRDHAYFQRAVDRFRAVAASAEPKTILIVDRLHAMTETDFEAITRHFDERARDAVVLVVQPTFAPRPIGAMPRMTDRWASGRHRCLTYDALSRLDALAFDDMLDDVVLARTVAGFGSEA